MYHRNWDHQFALPTEFTRNTPHTTATSTTTTTTTTTPTATSTQPRSGEALTRGTPNLTAGCVLVMTGGNTEKQQRTVELLQKHHKHTAGRAVYTVKKEEQQTNSSEGSGVLRSFLSLWVFFFFFSPFGEFGAPSQVGKFGRGMPIATYR